MARPAPAGGAELEADTVWLPPAPLRVAAAEEPSPAPTPPAGALVDVTHATAPARHDDLYDRVYARELARLTRKRERVRARIDRDRDRRAG
jgi:hypothetical protein